LLCSFNNLKIIGYEHGFFEIETKLICDCKFLLNAIPIIPIDEIVVYLKSINHKQIWKQFAIYLLENHDFQNSLIYFSQANDQIGINFVQFLQKQEKKLHTAYTSWFNKDYRTAIFHFINANKFDLVEKIIQNSQEFSFMPIVINEEVFSKEFYEAAGRHSFRKGNFSKAAYFF
jgi:hypothetical protein